MIKIVDEPYTQELSAIRALHRLIFHTFDRVQLVDYETTISDTKVLVKRMALISGTRLIAFSGPEDEMEKVVLAARIISNNLSQYKRILKEYDNWPQFRFDTLLQILNIDRSEWRASGLKLTSEDLLPMLEFALKFPDMRFSTAVETGRRFYAALNERLLDLATSPGCEKIFSTYDYTVWEYTGELGHVREMRFMRGPVTASIHDAQVPNLTAETLNKIHDHLGIPRPGDPIWNQE